MLAIFIFSFIFINRVLLNEEYQNYINVGFFYHLFCKSFEQKLFLKSKINIDSESKILDFGCGTGIISEFFGNNYIGIDIDKTRINYARKVYPNKKFLLVTDENLPFNDNHFDVILFNDCLHHISDYKINKIFPELHRILNKNGKIIIREPKKDTNIFTYFLTEICENGNYVRTVKEYKNLFKSFDFIYEESFNEIVREYYVLIVQKNNIFIENTYNNVISYDREVMNLLVLFVFYYSLYNIITHFF